MEGTTIRFSLKDIRGPIQKLNIGKEEDKPNVEKRKGGMYISELKKKYYTEKDKL